MRTFELFGSREGPRLVDAPTTRRERVRGLRGRTLHPETAMLFERCRSVHTFGMLVPISVVFVDQSWHVVRVIRAPPGRLLFCRRARHVLECHVGVDVRVGDVLSLRAAPGGRATRGDRDSARPART